MAREFPPPEQATSWEEFQERYIHEWAYHNNRTRSLRSVFMGMVGCCLLIVAFIFLLYAIGKMHGPGHAWQWLGVVIPVAIVAVMLRRAWILGSRDGKRQSQLEALKQEWQQRVDRGEIPHTRAEAEGRTS